MHQPSDFSENLRLLMRALEHELKRLPKGSPEWNSARTELDGYEQACRQGAAGYRELSFATFKRTIEQAESQNRGDVQHCDQAAMKQ